MPPKRAAKVLEPSQSRCQDPYAAKKAPRPAATKKKQAVAQPVVATNEFEKVTNRLKNLLGDNSTDARSIVDFIMSPLCGLESGHDGSLRFSDSTKSYTPFLMAAQRNRLDGIQLLLSEYSPNTDAADRQCALHFAASNNNSEMVSCLVQHNGRLIDALDSNGNTPLYYATYDDRVDVALLLLELGANARISNRWQTTPLHVCDDVYVAKALLAKGAHIDAVDRENNTPLHSALSYDNRSLASFYLEYGANPNIRGEQQLTPLHFASMDGMTDMAETLLANGAFIDVIDSTGRTPLGWVIDSNHRGTVGLLKGET